LAPRNWLWAKKSIKKGANYEAITGIDSRRIGAFSASWRGAIGPTAAKAVDA